MIKSRRITEHKGLLNTTQLDCPLSKITGVQVEQGIFGRIFNYGTVCISTASVLLKFEYIEGPDGFRDMLNDQIEMCECEKIQYIRNSSLLSNRQDGSNYIFKI